MADSNNTNNASLLHSGKRSEPNGLAKHDRVVERGNLADRGNEDERRGRAERSSKANRDGGAECDSTAANVSLVNTLALWCYQPGGDLTLAQPVAPTLAAHHHVQVDVASVTRRQPGRTIIAVDTIVYQKTKAAPL